MWQAPCLARIECHAQISQERTSGLGDAAAKRVENHQAVALRLGEPGGYVGQIRRLLGGLVPACLETSHEPQDVTAQYPILRGQQMPTLQRQLTAGDRILVRLQILVVLH